MNSDHLELLVSDGWRELLRDFIMPSALGSTDLGDDVLEVGPGPGMTTDLLRQRVPKLTAIEIDPVLAAELAGRLAGSNIEVINADATDMPFDDDRFSSAVSFTMLHHVPSALMQDDLFGEVARVLQPGGVFVASDSDDLAALHTNDMYNPVDPATLEGRLGAARFSAIEVRANDFGWTASARA